MRAARTPKFARSQTAPHRQVQRAEALLLATDGVANAPIAERVGVTTSTLPVWQEHFRPGTRQTWKGSRQAGTSD